MVEPNSKPPGNRLCADMHVELLNLAWSGPCPSKRRMHLLPQNIIDPHSFIDGRFMSPAKNKANKGLEILSAGLG